MKLSDFGIARAASHRHRTEAGVLKGKFAYMAPEQLVGAAADSRADLFALSIVFAEMLIARRLFTGKNDLGLITKVRDVELEVLHAQASRLPTGLLPLVLRGLAQSPFDRWQGARLYRDALGQWLEGQPHVTTADLATFIREVVVAPSSGAPEVASAGKTQAQRGLSIGEHWLRKPWRTSRLRLLLAPRFWCRTCLQWFVAANRQLAPLLPRGNLSTN